MQVTPINQAVDGQRANTAEFDGMEKRIAAVSALRLRLLIG